MLAARITLRHFSESASMRLADYFVASWIAVIFVMDGTLKDAQGREHQLDIFERSGRRAMNEAAARLRG